MEVIATIGVISSVVQLVDFSSRCLAKGVQLYQSTSGVLDENEAIGTALEHLVSLKDVVLNATASDADSALKELCQAVTGAALELAEALEKVKVKKAPGEAARWRSMRKAIRSVWSKEKIRELEHRLEGLRLELSLHITFKTREQLSGLEVELRAHFQSSGDATKSVLDAILADRDVFATKFDKQLALLESIESSIDLHSVALRDQVRDHILAASGANEVEHSQTRLALKETETNVAGELVRSTETVVKEIRLAEDGLRGTVEASSAVNQEEHIATQAQISELKQALRALSQQIKEQSEQHMRLLTEFNKSKSRTKRKHLGERSNAVAVALLALETMYRTLQSVLTHLQANTLKALSFKQSRNFWNVITYARKTSSSTKDNNETTSCTTTSTQLQLSRDLYFVIQYNWITQHRQLINLDEMQKRWPSTDPESSEPDDLASDCKLLWLLTAVTAALRSHNISDDQVIPALIERRFPEGRRTCCPKPRTSLYPFISGTSRAAHELDVPFTTDVSFWISLAEKRRLMCTGADGSCAHQSKATDDDIPTRHSNNKFDLLSLESEHDQDLEELLGWLIGISVQSYTLQPLPLQVKSDERAFSPAVLVAECLQNMGLGIKIGDQSEFGEGRICIISYEEETNRQKQEKQEAIRALTGSEAYSKAGTWSTVEESTGAGA